MSRGLGDVYKRQKHPSAVIAPEEPFDLYEIELSDEDADFTAAE